jgi:hypothetical protein
MPSEDAQTAHQGWEIAQLYANTLKLPGQMLDFVGNYIIGFLHVTYGFTRIDCHSGPAPTELVTVGNCTVVRI